MKKAIVLTALALTPTLAFAGAKVSAMKIGRCLRFP